MQNLVHKAKFLRKNRKGREERESRGGKDRVLHRQSFIPNFSHTLMPEISGCVEIKTTGKVKYAS